MYIITGGGSGIGRALALSLVSHGKSVLIVGRRAHLLQETAAHSDKISVLCADLSTLKGRNSLRGALNDVSQISALVNNAGTIAPVRSLQNIALDEWHQCFNTNLDTALFLPQMLQQQLQQGRVLNIGSGAAYFPIKGWAAYCASKAALSMLTRCWQLETTAISFASVMPGIIDTDMQTIARNGVDMDAEQVEFYQRLKNENRLLSVKTVAEFLTWLLLSVDAKEFVAQEWDIYDTSHHGAWLKPPYQVLHWDF